MKKHNLLSKATLSLIAVSMSVVLLGGCQSSKSNTDTSKVSSNSTESSSTKNTTSDTTQDSTKPTEEQMKTQTQESIQPLITAGTITQAQADKIVTALSTRPAKNSDNQSKPQDNGQTTQQEKPQNDGQIGKGGPLSQLVTDGVITQAQADAVMEKVRGNFKKPNNVQGTQNNTQTSTKESSN